MWNTKIIPPPPPPGPLLFLINFGKPSHAVTLLRDYIKTFLRFSIIVKYILQTSHNANLVLSTGTVLHCLDCMIAVR